jgi:DNA-binding response OmpR family regulator
LVEELRDISTVPILVLAPEIDETEASTALELGADDYLLFPCGLWQFAARVWAVLRRSGFVPFRDERQRFLISGRLLIDPQGHEVYLDDQKVRLTPTEFRLLYLLARNHGRVVPHQVLENELRSNRESMPPSTKKHIQRLRSKLADNPVDPRWIASVYGVGYRFVGPRPQWQGSLHTN